MNKLKKKKIHITLFRQNRNGNRNRRIRNAKKLILIVEKKKKKPEKRVTFGERCVQRDADLRSIGSESTENVHCMFRHPTLRELCRINLIINSIQSVSIGLDSFLKHSTDTTAVLLHCSRGRHICRSTRERDAMSWKVRTNILLCTRF